MENEQLQQLVNENLRQLAGKIEADIREIHSICATHDFLLQMLYCTAFNEDTQKFNNMMAIMAKHAETSIREADNEIDRTVGSRNLHHITRFRESVLSRLASTQR